MLTGTQVKTKLFPAASRQTFLDILNKTPIRRQVVVFFALFFLLYWVFGLTLEAIGLWRGFDVDMLVLWRGESEILVQLMSLGLLALVFWPTFVKTFNQDGRLWTRCKLWLHDSLALSLDTFSNGFFKGALASVSIVLLSWVLFGENVRWPMSFAEVAWGKIWSLFLELLTWTFWIAGLEAARAFIWSRLASRSWAEAGALVMIFEGFLIWQLVMVPMDAPRRVLVILVVALWTLWSGMEFFYDQIRGLSPRYSWVGRMGVKTGFLFFLVNIFGLNLGVLRNDSMFFLSPTGVEELTLSYRNLGVVGHPSVWLICGVASLIMSWKLLTQVRQNSSL